MNSWDLFRTLCHARDGNAGEAPIHEHYPIAENIAKVQPGDIVVSEYYDRVKAEVILRDICGLKFNTLVVTEKGKTTGDVWKNLRPERHTGDNLHCDVQKPREHGIQTAQVFQHERTPDEREFINQGDTALANVIREARLTTWNDDPTLRGLQLHQIERNFPFLLKVAHVLHKRMIDGGYFRLLVCSRDGYLLFKLMDKLFQPFDCYGYCLRYFHSSRLTRYRPTERYAEYAKSMIGDKTLIVDMNGTGNSLKYFTDRFGGDPLLVVSHTNVVPSLVHGGICETSNLAPHESINMDDMSANSTDDRRVREMVSAFRVCCGLSLRENPNYTLDWALRRMEDPRTECLWEGHLADSKATYDLLNSGELPHEVIL
jgi:hypothetical protein